VVENILDFVTEIAINTDRIDPKWGVDALDLKLFQGHVIVPAKLYPIFHGLPGRAYNVDANLRRLLA
jgi:hypothetical protein